MCIGGCDEPSTGTGIELTPEIRAYFLTKRRPAMPQLWRDEGDDS